MLNLQGLGSSARIYYNPPMVRSNAPTVENYLDELPDDRRMAVEAIRKVILENLPDGYEEAMNWGMISYQVPLERYPDTYNGQPLGFVALASQKNHMSLYLMCVYADSKAEEWLRVEFEKRGKKLDMGKSCLRFKKLDDLPVDVIGQLVSRTPVDKTIENYERSRPSR